MPLIEDWSTKPFNVVQKIFEENKDCSHETFISQVEDYFRQRLTEGSVSKIPSLNHTSVDRIASGSLVRYRCMVQDVFDPQFYLGQYSVKNTQTQETRQECGSFRDGLNMLTHETVDEDNEENKPFERFGFYCVPIPGEAQWVKKAFGQNCANLPESSSGCSDLKRKKDEDDNDSTTEAKYIPSPNSTGPLDKNGGNTDTNSMNKTRGQPDGVSSCANTSVSSLAHNFPLPGETGTPCIIRAYSSKIEIKITDVVEVFGILSVDPALASIADDEEGMEQLIDREELRAHEPPPSLVPRIHALVVQMAQHNNPLLPKSISSDLNRSELEKLLVDMGTLRLELHSIFKHALLGDGLAAEYLICYLVGKIYSRVDGLALGKFCLNLSGCPVTQRYTMFLNHLISQLTTKSTLMEMTIDNMNSWRLIPKKDYAANRITAGMLQLSAGTHLVLDETALQQGRLNNTGVMNVRALNDVIECQKVEYDFQFNAVPMPCDIKVLILSECNSLLSKDFHVPLVTEAVDDIPSYFALLDKRLTDEILSKLRSFITACQKMANFYEVHEDLQKIIQDDFVESRQESPSEMTVEDFQKLLNLLKAMTLSMGLWRPHIEIWNKVRRMERQRKERVDKLPKPSNGTS